MAYCWWMKMFYLIHLKITKFCKSITQSFCNKPTNTPMFFFSLSNHLSIQLIRMDETDFSWVIVEAQYFKLVILLYAVTVFGHQLSSFSKYSFIHLFYFSVQKGGDFWKPSVCISYYNCWVTYWQKCIHWVLDHCFTSGRLQV